MYITLIPLVSHIFVEFWLLLALVNGWRKCVGSFVARQRGRVAKDVENSVWERNCDEDEIRVVLWNNSPSKYCQDGRSKNHTEINPRNQNTFDSSFVYVVMRVCLSGLSYKIHHSFWHFMLWHFICHRCSKFIFIHFHERLLNFVKFLKINFLSSSSSRKYLQYLSPNFTVFIRIVSFRCIA